MDWRKRKKRNRILKNHGLSTWNEYRCMLRIMNAYSRYINVLGYQKDSWEVTIAGISAGKEFWKSHGIK